MAVAIDGAERFGKGESTITARLPLMVRPSAPRFLNFGDRFELPVVVQNQTDAALDVDVVVQGSNLVFIDAVERRRRQARDGAGQRPRRGPLPGQRRPGRHRPVPSRRRRRRRRRIGRGGRRAAGVHAGDDRGVRHLRRDRRCHARRRDQPADRARRPACSRSSAGSRSAPRRPRCRRSPTPCSTSTTTRTRPPTATPRGSWRSPRCATCSTRSTPTGCPTRRRSNARMDADIAALAALQNDDGGWSWWARGLESSPWQSIQSTHALVLAQQAGYAVPDATLDRGARVPRRHREPTSPADCSHEVRDRAARLRDPRAHARRRPRRRQGDRASTTKQGDDLQLDAMAWLWPSIDDASIRAEIERRLENAAAETAGAATFATSYGEDDYLIANSDRRTDGVILDALIGETPDSDLIVKAVNGLLGHQTRGRWNNVQDNAFILIALNRYFDTFESVTPDFVARVWLGDTYAAEHEYRGRTTDRDNTLVPMDQLDAGHRRSSSSATASGRLYYRLGLRYAPDDLQLAARDEGFVVDRVYEAVDDPGDVTRDADGTWHIRAGATVRVQADDGRRRPAHARRARRSAAGRSRTGQPGARGVADDPPPEESRRRSRMTVVLVLAVVRAPEHPRRPGRGVHQLSRRRHLRVHLHRPRHDPRPVRRPARQGRGDLRPRGLRPLRLHTVVVDYGRRSRCRCRTGVVSSDRLARCSHDLFPEADRNVHRSCRRNRPPHRQRQLPPHAA